MRISTCLVFEARLEIVSMQTWRDHLEERDLSEVQHSMRNSLTQVWSSPRMVNEGIKLPGGLDIESIPAISTSNISAHHPIRNSIQRVNSRRKRKLRTQQLPPHGETSRPTNKLCRQIHHVVWTKPLRGPSWRRKRSPLDTSSECGPTSLRHLEAPLGSTPKKPSHHEPFTPHRAE